MIDGQTPLEVLPVKGLNATTHKEGYELFALLDQQMREQAPNAIWQPNWLAGAALEWPGGYGAGAGPGARPLPLEGLTTKCLPLRKWVKQLRRGVKNEAARTEKGNVRLIILDGWNDNHEETARHLQRLPFLRYLNDHARGERFRQGKDYAAVRHDDPDPFPMPDHGLFAAYLASQVIGMQHLQLHPSIMAELSEQEQALLALQEANGCLSLDGISHLLKRLPGAKEEQPDSLGPITLESVRVLDEYGVGDSKRLIQSLIELADTIQPDERVIVNMSLVLNMPDYRHLSQDICELFDGRWPGQDKCDDQLDRAFHQAIESLHNKGALLFGATGNNSQGEVERLDARFPAAYQEVVDITAARYDGTSEAYYANRATAQGLAVFAGDVNEKRQIDPRYPLAGPFTDSHIPIPGDNNDPANQKGAVAWAGTSFATPLASGLAALLWAANPTQNAEQVRSELLALAKGRTLGNGTPFVDLFAF
jgi:hypothetical protein